MIRLENIGLRFGSKTVLDGLSVEIPTGTKVAVKGESGSGKSGLLRILLGFEPGASGKIYYNNLLLTPANIRKIRSQTAYVPQDLGFTVFRSTRELFFAPFRFKANRHLLPHQNTIDHTFRRFGLPDDILNRGIKAISGGQKQRLLLAQAVLLKKPFILLDEPTSALDEANRRIVADIILRLPATVVAATHDEDWIARSDMVIDLDRMHKINNL